MYHSLKIAAIAAVVAVSAMPEAVQAQTRETIRIHNQSGETMYYFQATDTRYDIWGEDLLGSRVLNNGQTWTLTFSNVTNCIYDFRITYQDGDVYEDYGVDICRRNTYTLR
jgi:hypothetical protein